MTGEDAQPALVVISGPSGSGKTTLAHELAQAIRCPAICRDEIKEGMVHAHGTTFTPDWGDALTQRTFPLFFRVVRTLLEEGVTLVAEAAFQDKLWRPNLEPLLAMARLRIVQCHVAPDIARERIGARASSRTAHADAALLAILDEDPDALTNFDRVALTPSIDVDTTSGYDPSIEKLVAFVNSR